MYLPKHNLSLIDTRGESYPPIGDDPRRVADYVKRQMELTEPMALVRLKEATRGLLFADGEQHIDWNKRERVWKVSPNPHGRVRATVNLILPILRARIARMVSSEVNWDATPTTNALEDRDRAFLVERLLESHWTRSDMEAVLRLSLLLAYTTGFVAWKQFWNPNIGTKRPATLVIQNSQGQWVETYCDRNGEPITNESGDPLDVPDQAYWYTPGDVDTALRTVWNLRVNNEATGWTSAEGLRWIIDSEVVPISVVKERYGPRAMNVQPVAGTSVLRTFQAMIRSVATSFGFPVPQAYSSPNPSRGSKEVYDSELTLVKEYWELPSEVLPEGRMVITAGDEVMFDGELPYGIVPYVGVYDERRLFDPWGRPVVKDLIPPQKVLNLAWGLIVEEMNRHGIGQWASFDVPGVPDQLTDEHGAILKIPLRASVTARRIGDVIQRMPSPTIPRDRWEILNVARQAMFDIGAFHEVSRGQIPPGIESGIAVQLLQESEVMQLDAAVRSLKNSLLQWAYQRLIIAKWGYGNDEERFVPSGRKDLEWMMDSMTGRDLPDPDTITVDLKGFRPQSKASLRAEVKELMVAQVIDPQTGLRALDLGRGVEGMFASQTRHFSRARAENRALERGEYEIDTGDDGQARLMHTDGSPFMLAEFDDHGVHIEVLTDLILDDTKPYIVRQAAMLHAVEHKGVLLQQQQEDITRALKIEQAAQAAGAKANQ